MTVIAWDGKTLAADKQSTFCGLPRTTTKIHRAKDGSLLGAAGETAMCAALRAWYDAGAVTADFPDKSNTSHLLVIRPDGQVYLYDGHAVPIHLEDPFTALGSGRDYAMAALHLGKTAAEAVQVACVFDAWCGNGIDTLERTP
jgi:ATP-dependent protease HslVU (ClpYQ) peptidase subunit